ncbi:hypothetical protein [Clostridium aciditolerans]|uniref:Uncharacterized protein n=1 Tax=Clostridium aciditolerans TaxID=339861 RepID=A0A934HQ10_9CLOT|nr:hypothetical protein [Clostridium aciditolerans]MBI6871143.1 hypothetical protein [Clostridium aciditolerans]
MKIFKRIFLWILISLTIQFAGLFYADKYFLATNTSIKTKKVVKSEAKKQDAEVKIPDNATHVNASFNARYLAYYDGDVLKVINTKTGEEKKVDFEDGVQVSFYKWLPDRNRMLIAEKETGKKGSSFKLAYYDVDKDVKEDIKELDWADKNAEVEDIQASPLTNIIYVKVANSGKRSSIYWINIMKEMKKVDTMAYMIGKIKVVPHEDKLIYEDLTHHRIYITGQDEPLDINGVNNPSLIAVDDEDRVYIGETQDDKISKIYYGSVKEGRNSLQTIDLGTAVDKDAIYVSSQGKIYINDNLKGVVREVASGKEYIYQGRFIQIYTDGIISVSDGKMVKTLFN